MQAFALVDYDNVKTTRRESARLDVHSNLNEIVESIAAVRRDYSWQVGEIVIRLYGGWISESGQYTQLASWLLSVLGDFRGRRSGVRIRPELATGLISVPEITFLGTHRRNSGQKLQKLVDSMMAVDLFHLGIESDCPLLVFSNDDDIVPPVLYAATRQRPPALLRSRAAGDGLNDHALMPFNLLFSTR